MSADNWSVCPRCFDGALRQADEAKMEVMGLYGTIPVEEFDAQRDALVEPKPEDFQTFREDYEFYGAHEGELRARYKGRCTVCALSVELCEDRVFWTPETAAAASR